jgi:hypothetical protein
MSRRLPARPSITLRSRGARRAVVDHDHLVVTGVRRLRGNIASAAPRPSAPALPNLGACPGKGLVLLWGYLRRSELNGKIPAFSTEAEQASSRPCGHHRRTTWIDYRPACCWFVTTTGKEMSATATGASLPSTSRRPDFTVLLPVHRPPTLLPYATETVLAQSLPNFESFIICDGASEETVACARDFGTAKRWPRLMGPIIIVNIISAFITDSGLNTNGLVAKTNGSIWLGWFYQGSPYLGPQVLAAAYEGAFATFLFGNFYFNPNLWTMTFEFFGSFLVFGLALLYLKIKRYQFVVVLGIAAIAASFQPFYLCFIAGIGLATVRQRLSGFNWPGLDRRWQAIGAVAAVALESGQPVSGCAEPLCRDGADYIVRNSGANHDFQQTHS